MIDILFQNKNFIVAVKPAGISSQSDNCGGEDMTALLKKQTGSDIFPVHRLDKVTGGVMLYAKNSAAAAKFAKITADGCFIKRYFAVVVGKPEKSAARLEDFLIFDKYSGKSAIVESSVKGAKKAVLEYTQKETVFSDGVEYSLLDVRLFTGRTHQIRAQLANIGFPIVGDGKYGSKIKAPLALWSYEADFPASESEHIFRASPPEIFPWNIFESIKNKGDEK